MTNREKYLDEILASLCGTAKVRADDAVCNGKNSCKECIAKNLEWLKSDYKEPEHIHDDCYFCKKIEGLNNMRFCSKRCHSINGTETINGCYDFKERK